MFTLLAVGNYPAWMFWGMLICFGGALLVLLLFPLLIFVVALFENIRIPSFDPVAAQTIPPSAPLNAAENAGFTLIGHFTDGDKGIRRGVMSFALSPDALILLRVAHGKLIRRIELISRYADQRWLLTLNNKGMADLSKLEMTDNLTDASFDMLMQHHLSRLATMAQSPVPFLPQKVIADCKQHVHDRVQIMLRTGLARYTSPNRSTWKHTAKGAARLMAQLYRELPQTVSDVRRKAARQQQLEAGLKYQDFLVAVPPSPAPVNLPPPPPASPTPSISAADAPRPPLR